MRGKKSGYIGNLRQWVYRHKQLICIGVPAALLLLLLLVQLFYPRTMLLPLQSVDNSSYGFTAKKDAAKALDARYKKTTIDLYFGNAKKPQFTPRLSEVGITVKNTDRLEELSYRWYWRLVPTSIFWAQHVIEPTKPNYQRNSKALDAYLSSELKGSCSVAPQNATAKVKGAKVVVVPEEDGGVCKEQDVRRALSAVQPVLPSKPIVRVSMDPRPASLRSADIKPIVDTINEQLTAPVKLHYDNTSLDVAPGEVAGWLEFNTESDEVLVTLNHEKSDTYLHAQLDEKIARPAGVTKVTTQDFVEVSREDGPLGRAIDTGRTREQVVEYLMGRADTVSVGIAAVEPKVEYTRKYSNSDTGLSALMKHFAETHPGVYGVSLIELDGKRRRASFEDTRKFTTASTYKLYVAFSTLKRVESGEFKWSDKIAGGRNLEQCFEDMIAKSDNPCAEALVAKIGYRPITQDAHTVVSTNTTFLDTESYKTTAGDLSTFMASLATGQIPLRAENVQRLTGSLKRNVYRQGIPADANGDVADKVGFLDGFLHDAAIVYSPSGTYALSIMSDGSSWADIAKLTREIEKLRGQ